MQRNEKKRSRRGSETRQKGRVIGVRVSAAEEAELIEKAQAAGLSKGSYIRARLLKVRETKATRAPRIETEELSRLLGQVNKAGSNIAQIYKRVNFGETLLDADFREALKAWREATAAIMEALGRGKP